MFIEYENRFDILNEKPESIPLEITQAQAIEDLNQYIYLLETSCAGFIEQREKINFQERYILEGEIVNQKTKITEKSQIYFLPVIHNSNNKEYLECRGLIPDYWATTDSELEETLEYFCK